MDSKVIDIEGSDLYEIQNPKTKKTFTSSYRKKNAYTIFIVMLNKNVSYFYN